MNNREIKIEIISLEKRIEELKKQMWYSINMTPEEKRVLKVVSETHQVTEEDILWVDRKREVSTARKEFVYLLIKSWKTYYRVWEILSRHYASPMYLYRQYVKNMIITC